MGLFEVLERFSQGPSYSPDELRDMAMRQEQKRLDPAFRRRMTDQIDPRREAVQRLQRHLGNQDLIDAPRDGALGDLLRDGYMDYFQMPGRIVEPHYNPRWYWEL